MEEELEDEEDLPAEEEEPDRVFDFTPLEEELLEDWLLVILLLLPEMKSKSLPTLDFDFFVSSAFLLGVVAGEGYSFLVGMFLFSKVLVSFESSIWIFFDKSVLETGLASEVAVDF